MLGASAISPSVLAAGNGHGPKIPDLPAQALSAPGQNIPSPGLPVIPNVIPASMSAPTVPVVVVPAVPSVTPVLPAAPTSMPAAAIAAVPAQPGISPAVGTAPAGGLLALPSAANAAGNRAPTAVAASAPAPSLPGNPGAGAVFTTNKGDVMLAAGQSVELVDPSAPGLRVQVSAPADKALDIGAIVGASRQNGIYAGLSRQNGPASASRAISLPDGRILLAAVRPANAVKSADHAGSGNSGIDGDARSKGREPDGNGAPGLLRANSVNGRAAASGLDGEVAPARSGGGDDSLGGIKTASPAERATASPAERATASPAEYATASPAEHATASRAGADAEEVVANNAGPVSHGNPRTCG